MTPAGLLLPSEGGNTDLAPVEAVEWEIARLLAREVTPLTWEHVLAGPGLERLYRAVGALWGIAVPAQPPAATITDLALAGEDPVAVHSLEVFCRWLGAFAGNMALMWLPYGGVYLTGGIGPRIAGFLANSEFRARFEDRGRLAPVVAEMATLLVTAEQPGLVGAAVYLRGELAR